MSRTIARRLATCFVPWLAATLATAQDTPPAPVETPVAPGPAAPPPPGLADLLVGRIAVSGAEPLEFRFGLETSDGIRFYRFSGEQRPGVAAVLGGYTRTKGKDERSGVSLYLFLHLYDDGAHFLEGMLLNDAMSAPPGKVEATWKIAYRGATVVEGGGPLFDQCGIGFAAGEPRFAPREDLLEKYLKSLPAPESVRGVSFADATKVDDPDPTANTHAAGSPRNRYHAVEAAKYHFGGDAQYLARLMDYVLVQARRPYHLAEVDGTPFRSDAHPDCRFLEGRPELKAYLETFGRLSLAPGEIESPPQNGWDHEHMNVEELYAAYVFTGSRLARRELLLIAEQLLTTPYVKEPGYPQHSARAFGWVARALVRAAQASSDPRYLDAVRRMMDSLRKGAVMEGAYRALVPQAPRGDHMADERWESPFMVAVAASAIALYLEASPEDERARDLLRFCGDLLVDQGYSPTNGGFFYDYAVDSGKKTGVGDRYDGVVLMIPSALVAVARELPEAQREKYLAPARRVYAAQSAQPWGKPSQDHFHRWLLLAARELDGP
jgi:hypothetical protein